MRTIESDQPYLHCSHARRKSQDTSGKPWRPWCVDVIDENQADKGIAYRYITSGRRAALAMASELQRLNKNKLRLDIKPLSHREWRNKNND